MKTQNLSRFLFSVTRNIILETLKIGKINMEMEDLEFENHGFLKNHVCPGMLNGIPRHKF